MAEMLEIVLSQKPSFIGYDSKTSRKPSRLLLSDGKRTDVPTTRLIGHITCRGVRSL